MAKCDLQVIDDCESFVLPNDTLILDLSRNGLVEVPSCVLNKSSSIIALSLSENNINVIAEQSFPVMRHLVHLDMSFNELYKWKGDISTTLPILQSIDLTGNHFYFPGDNLVSLSTLVEINGVTWNADCSECQLVKTELLINLNDSEQACIVDPEEYVFADEIKYGRSLSFVKRGFSPQCLCEGNCFVAEIGTPFNVALNSLPRKLFYVEYIFGAIAVVLNLVVIFVSFGCRSLRKSTSFILIGNIGVCDVIMGVYSVLIARYTVYEFIVNENEYPGMDVFVNDYCTIMGAIFTTAQITSVSSSFLATLDRYLSIVYCMNPEARLRKTVALWCLAAIWSVSIGYSLLAVFQVGGLRYHGEFTCMMPFVNGPELTDTSITGLAVASFLVLLYLISIALYVHIFFHVRKTGISAGVKRKAALAKSISLMVCTNFVFFIIPMVCTLLFVYKYDQLMEAFKVDSLRGLKVYFIMLSWLPVVFLSFNSCLNPFLCAFRHPKFRKELSAYSSKCQCTCLQRSREQLPHAWKITATKSVEFTSTDAMDGNGIANESYRSLETLF
ncbi:hypothetical protein ACROYT_G002925 [Oculina patagonica]